MAYKYKAVKVNGKKVDEHRWIWEQHYGPIPPGGIIHHKDENPRNNDIENLELTFRSPHGRHHYKKVIPKNYEEWYKNCVEANRKRCLKKFPEGYSECNKCKRILPIEMFDKNRITARGIQYQCKECKKDMRR